MNVPQKRSKSTLSLAEPGLGGGGGQEAETRREVGRLERRNLELDTRNLQLGEENNLLRLKVIYYQQCLESSGSDVVLSGDES